MCSQYWIKNAWPTSQKKNYLNVFHGKNVNCDIFLNNNLLLSKWHCDNSQKKHTHQRCVRRLFQWRVSDLVGKTTWEVQSIMDLQILHVLECHIMIYLWLSQELNPFWHVLSVTEWKGCPFCSIPLVHVYTLPWKEDREIQWGWVYTSWTDILIILRDTVSEFWHILYHQYRGHSCLGRESIQSVQWNSIALEWWLRNERLQMSFWTAFPSVWCRGRWTRSDIPQG